MSGDALSCSACGYENVVAGCGFCLQCGAEFTVSTAVKSAEPPEYQAALAAAEKLSEVEVDLKLVSQETSSAVTVPDADIPDVDIPDVGAGVVTTADESAAGENKSEHDRILVRDGGTLDFLSAIDSAEQWDFENGQTSDDCVDASVVGGTVDVSPPSPDDFPDLDEADSEEPAAIHEPIAEQQQGAIAQAPSSQALVEKQAAEAQAEEQSAPVSTPEAATEKVPNGQQPSALGSQDLESEGPPPADSSVETPQEPAAERHPSDKPEAATTDPESQATQHEVSQDQDRKEQPIDDEFDVPAEAVVTATVESTKAEETQADSEPDTCEERPSFSTSLARELHTTIVAAVESAGMRLREENDRLVAQMVIEGRPQPVFIDRTFTSDDTPILSFYAVCGPASPGNALPLLEWNRALALCAFAVREIDGTKMFVIQSNLLAYSLDIMTLRKTLIEIAKRANQVNERLI